MHRGLAGGEDPYAPVEQSARRALEDQRLQITVPEARVDHIRPRAEQRRDLGVVLTGEELGHLRGLDLDPGNELLHRRLEIVPGILAPGVVLVEAGDRLDAALGVFHEEGRAYAVHGRGGRSAEHVLVARVLEYARRAAVEEVGELLELLGDRRDRQAVAARDVADHQIDVVALHEIPELGDLRGAGARFVHHHDLDPGAAETRLAVGRGRFARIQLVDHEIRGVLRRHAEGRGRGAGQERHDADLDRRLRRRAEGRERARDQPSDRKLLESLHDVLLD